MKFDLAEYEYPDIRGLNLSQIFDLELGISNNTFDIIELDTNDTGYWWPVSKLTRECTVRYLLPREFLN